jgi:hypothetical protein
LNSNLYLNSFVVAFQKIQNLFSISPNPLPVLARFGFAAQQTKSVAGPSLFFLQPLATAPLGLLRPVRPSPVRTTAAVDGENPST